MVDVKRRARAYHSPLREQQARDTRARIVTAARDLFVRDGYVATSIEDVAAAAGVSPRTVYAGFGSKIELLRAVRESAFSPEGPREAGWIHPAFKAVFAERDIRRGVRTYARLLREALERTADLAAVFTGAAGADPDVAALLAEGRLNHLRQSQRYVRFLADHGALREGLGLKEAADSLYTITGHEPYARLVRDRGWSGARFEKWTTDAITRLLLR